MRERGIVWGISRLVRRLVIDILNHSKRVSYSRVTVEGERMRK